MTQAQVNANSAYNAFLSGFLTYDQYAANSRLNGIAPLPNPFGGTGKSSSEVTNDDISIELLAGKTKISIDAYTSAYTNAAKIKLDDATRLMNSIAPRFFESLAKEWGFDLRGYYDYAQKAYQDACNAIASDMVVYGKVSKASEKKAFEAERAAQEAYEMAWTADYELRSRLVSAAAFNDLTSLQDRKDVIWLYLTMELNIDFIHAAAIMGNIAIETDQTSFRSTQVQSNRKNYTYTIDDGVGCGLLQWSHRFRKERLKTYASQNNGSVWDYDIQLNFMVYEGTYAGYQVEYSKFLSIDKLDSATAYFCTVFEGKPDGDISGRQKEAKLIYDYYMMK